MRLLVSHLPPALCGNCPHANAIITATCGVPERKRRPGYSLDARLVQGSSGRVLLPWEIVQCHSEAINIRKVFCRNSATKASLGCMADELEVRSGYKHLHTCTYQTSSILTFSLLMTCEEERNLNNE